MTVPSIVMCFLSTPYWEVSFVAAFDYDPYVGIGETFRILFGDSWQYLWPVIVISIFQILGASLVMSSIDRHFRTGELSLRKPFRLLNNSIFPVAMGVLIMCALSIIMRFVLFGLVTLVQVVSGAIGFVAGATLGIISVISIVLFFFHVLILTPMLYWAPIVFIYGYRLRDAAATSFKLLSGKKVFRNLFIPLIICAAIQLLVGYLQPHIAVTYTVNFVIAIITNVFVPVFVMISFNKISGLDRRDLMPYENISLPSPTVDDKATDGRSATDGKTATGEEARAADIPDAKGETQSSAEAGDKAPAKKRSSKPKGKTKASKQVKSDRDGARGSDDVV